MLCKFSDIWGEEGTGNLKTAHLVPSPGRPYGHASSAPWSPQGWHPHVPLPPWNSVAGRVAVEVQEPESSGLTKQPPKNECCDWKLSYLIPVGKSWHMFLSENSTKWMNLISTVFTSLSSFFPSFPPFFPPSSLSSFLFSSLLSLSTLLSFLFFILFLV